MSSNNCHNSPYRLTCRGLLDETETDPQKCLRNGCCYDDTGKQPHCYKSYPDAKCPWYKGKHGELTPIKKPSIAQASIAQASIAQAGSTYSCTNCKCVPDPKGCQGKIGCYQRQADDDLVPARTDTAPGGRWKKETCLNTQLLASGVWCPKGQYPSLSSCQAVCEIYPPYRMGVHNIANQADCKKSGAGTNCWDSTAQGGSGDNTGRAIPSCYLPFSESVCPWLNPEGPPGPPKSKCAGGDDAGNPCTTDAQCAGSTCSCPKSGGLYNTQADCEDKMDGFGNNVGNEWCCDPNEYNPDYDGTNCQGPCYYKCPKHGWSSQNKKCLCENGFCPDIWQCVGSKCVSGWRTQKGGYCNPAQGGNCYEGLENCKKNCK